MIILEIQYSYVNISFWDKFLCYTLLQDKGILKKEIILINHYYFRNLPTRLAVFQACCQKIWLKSQRYVCPWFTYQMVHKLANLQTKNWEREQVYWGLIRMWAKEKYINVFLWLIWNMIHGNFKFMVLPTLPALWINKVATLLRSDFKVNVKWNLWFIVFVCLLFQCRWMMLSGQLRAGDLHRVLLPSGKEQNSVKFSSVRHRLPTVSACRKDNKTDTSSVSD